MVHTRWAALQLPKLWSAADTRGKPRDVHGGGDDERAAAAPSREVAQREASCEASCDAGGYARETVARERGVERRPVER